MVEWHGRHLDSKYLIHHDDSMRTTVTLDNDVASQLRELVHRTRKPFKVVLNDAIRRGLGGGLLEKSSQEPFRVQPHPCRLRPGLDERRLNQLADELESEVETAELARGQ